MPALAELAQGRVAVIMLAALTVPAGAPKRRRPRLGQRPLRRRRRRPRAPGAPSPAAIAAADRILGDIGLKESVALVVPGMMAELETNVTRTRPEIKDSLRATLKSIQPEFDATAKQTYDQAATLLASQMSEKEITDVAAFFDSPTGKKYVAVTPVFLQQFADITGALARKAVDRHRVRARQEMKKKGVDF